MGEIIEADYTERPGTRAPGIRGVNWEPWSDEQRQLAYDTWSGEGEQRPGQTLAILRDKHGIDLPYRTLRRWIVDHDWSRRLLVERLDFTPSTVQEELVQNLAQSALYASRYLRDALSLEPILDAKGQPVRERLAEDGPAVTARGEVGNAPTGPVRLRSAATRELNQLAEIALTRFLGRADAGLVASLVREASGQVLDVNDATDDELARLASGDTRRPGHA